MDNAFRAHQGERLERLERSVQRELMPRLVHSRRASAATPQHDDVPLRRPPVLDVEAFVQAVRGPDDQRAADHVRLLLESGVALDTVYLDLLAPAARQLGAMWENDECDFVEVTVSLGRMQRLLRDLSQRFLADAGQGEPVGNILLTCVPGEQHTLGIIMVGEFLIRDGWRVLVGAPWTESDLLTMVGTEWYDVVGFSAGCEARLTALRRDIRRLKAASRNPNVQVMVGGPIFSERPELAEQIGAHAVTTCAKDAPRLARSLLPEARVFAPEGTSWASPGEHGQFVDAPRRA